MRLCAGRRGTDRLDDGWMESGIACDVKTLLVYIGRSWLEGVTFTFRKFCLV
jgi:hypothetical protein